MTNTPAETVERLDAIRQFLHGIGALDGCYFGERPPFAAGNFWWRTQVNQALTDAIAALTAPAPSASVAGEALDRPLMLAAARAWWASNMSSDVRNVVIKGDGRVTVYWRDADEDGKYTLPVDFLAALPSKPDAVTVPEPPQGTSLFAVNSKTGAWHYVNHAGTWQGMPNPLDATPKPDAPDRVTEGEIERAAVVAWLRKASEAARQHHAEVCYTEDDDVLDVIVERMNNHAFAADQIEAGVHLPAPSTTPARLLEENEALRKKVRQEIINSPETADFIAGVPLEAAHQRERWGVDHDAGKSPFDWFWLVGYLAQKAADAAVRGDAEKALHHTISTGAALANWHAHISGADTRMRPGIDPARAALGGETR